MKKKIKNNIMFQPIKVKDASKLFSSLGEVVLHIATGEPHKSMPKIVDVVTAFELKKTEEKLAWELINSAIVSAIVDLVSDSKNSILSLDKEIFAKNIKNLDYDKEIVVDDDFFERPKECQFIKDIQELLCKWLELAGVDDSKIAAIVYRLPTFFIYALHDEWANNSEKYKPLLKESPFGDSKTMDKDWDRYKAFLDKQTQEGVFNEAFGLSQIFIPLCGYYDVEITEREQKYTSREEGELPLGSEHTTKHTKKYKTVVDIEKYVREWLKNDDKEDFARLISGDPGSGKSSIAKMLASSFSDFMDVLFVPLHKLNLKKDVKEAVGDFFVSSRLFRSNPLDKPENLLIIFDGLDELTQQGGAILASARDFADQIKSMLGMYNYDKLQVRAIITGRELSIDETKTNFRKQGQIIHILPYKVDNKGNDYDDPHNLLEINKRDEWWEKYGSLTNSGYKNLPKELDKSDLEEITTQPLLNYLLALSFGRKKIDFSENTTINEIYEDLVDAVYERDWQSEHKSTQGIEKSDYFRVLEEIAVSAWQGNRRTATISEIEKRCGESGLGHILIDLQKKAEGGITNLLLAFYFRSSGMRDNDGNSTFEFTHKSFLEYFAARKIVRQLEETKAEVDRRKKTRFGWTIEDALENWINVCSKEPMDAYIYDFLRGEIQRKDIEIVEKWQLMLCELIDYVLKNGMPYHKQPISFFQMTKFSRNSEEALLATLSACAWRTNKTSKIRWPSNTAAGEWFSKLGGQQDQRRYTFAYSCLNHLDLTGSNLERRDLCGANLYGANLTSVDFWRADLYRANLNRVYFYSENPPSFSEANLDNVYSDFFYIINVRGSYYYHNGDYWQAINDFSKAIDMDPINDPLYSNRGIAYHKLEKYNLAIKDKTKAIELSPDNADYFYNRGGTFFYLHDYQSALSDYTKAIELDPKRALYYEERGIIYEFLKEYKKALEDKTEAIELEPNNAKYYRGRAITYGYLKRYKDQLADITKALELSPNNAGVRADYAYSLYKNGKIKRALKELKKSYKLYKHLSSYYRYKSAILLHMAKAGKPGDDAYLLDLINLAVEYSEGAWNSSVSYQLRGEFYLYKGELNKAFADIQKSIELYNYNEDAWFYMSEYYEQIKDAKEQQRCLEMAKSYGYN